MFERILVGIDGSAVAHLALEDAVKLAKKLSSRLRIISVVDLTPLFMHDAGGFHFAEYEQIVVERAQRELDKAAAVARREGVEADTILRRSVHRRVSDEIVTEAEEWPAELIILGTHGRSGVERLFLGSVAEGVARAAPVPVLLVRAPPEAAR